MASGPITSWQIDGKIMETVRGFIFEGFKITADSDYSHEIKRQLLLGRKAMTNLDSIIKSRGLSSQSYRCESQTIRRLSAKELMLLNCGLRRLLSPLDCKEIQSVNPKGNQS